MKHSMKLFQEPFIKISKGTKTIELRLYDEKRSKINVGDLIEFTMIDDSDQKIVVEVTALYRFNSFSDLYKKLPLNKLGYPAGKEASPDHMLNYYSADQQKKYGVVGIEFVLLHNESFIKN